MLEGDGTGDAWRVRIWDADGAFRGAGVLVSNRHVLTCAHVVPGDATALAAPAAQLRVDFPAKPALGKCAARVAEGGWFPVAAQGDAGASGNGDIAVLELAEPVAVPSAAIAPAGGALNRRVWMFGHPRGALRGVKAFARVSEKPAPDTDWVQLDAADVVGQRVDRGFSGAGVVDDETGAVIGILVAFYGTELAQVNWMLPIETIESYWPALRERVEGDRGVFTLEHLSITAVTTCSPWPDSHEISVTTREGRLLRRWWGQAGWTHWYDAQPPQPMVDAAKVPGVDGRMTLVAADVHGRMHRAEHRHGRRGSWEWGGWHAVSVPDEDSASPAVCRLAATSALPGHGEIFAVTAADELVHRWRRGGDEAPWSRWHLFTTPMPVRDVGATTFLPNRMLCVVADMHGRCWRAEHGDDGWSSWHRMSVPATRSPVVKRLAAASWRADHQEVFAVTAAGELVHRWRQDGGGWEKWQPFKTPAAVVDVAAGGQQDGVYECLVTDLRGRLWFARFSPRDFWSDWVAVDALPIA